MDTRKAELIGLASLHNISYSYTTEFYLVGNWVLLWISPLKLSSSTNQLYSPVCVTESYWVLLGMIHTSITCETYIHQKKMSWRSLACELFLDCGMGSLP